jgi:hypothetical protein
MENRDERRRIEEEMKRQGLPKERYDKVKDRIHRDKKGGLKGKKGDLTLDEIRDIIDDIIGKIWG